LFAAYRLFMRAAFTLIEVLVTVAIIALLLAVLVPALSSTREAARAAGCASNLRQIHFACRTYADANRGYGPAIGEPYAALPNWALVVQATGRKYRKADSSLYDAESVLVCPTVQAYYSQVMTRTYAMNTTGHAGLPGDPDTYDDPDNPAHIRFDAIKHTAETPLVLDSSRTTIITDGPPSQRTASMIDFRQPDHETRWKRFHRRGRSFNAVFFDGSAAAQREPRERWKRPLP
jgi:prepilin-type N-terminal cleavage/methylation domain-containing protein